MWALESAKHLHPRENLSFSHLPKAMAEETAVLGSSTPFSTFAQATVWDSAQASQALQHDTGGSTGF